MPDADVSSAIAQIKGRALSSVEFVHDYLQMHFDGASLTAYTHPTIHHAGALISWSASGYRDRLCDQIGSIVKEVSMNTSELSLFFESGTIISVSLEDEDYTGPEAFQFTGEDGTLLVI